MEWSQLTHLAQHPKSVGLLYDNILSLKVETKIRNTHLVKMFPFCFPFPLGKGKSPHMLSPNISRKRALFSAMFFALCASYSLNAGLTGDADLEERSF